MRAVIVIMLALTAICAQVPTQWALPAPTVVKSDKRQSFRFVYDYYYLTAKGDIERRERLSAVYTRGLPGDMVRWSDASSAIAVGESGEFGAPQKRDFMDGFTYRHDIGKGTLEPGFFKGFPPMAMSERDFIWDTQMIEGFGQDLLDKLKLNVPYRVPDTAELSLGGNGTFRHKDLKVTWVGMSRWNGRECALIQYQAFFNTLDIRNSMLNLTGGSGYWGDIWVALADARIEHATLFENVFGSVALQAQPKAIPVNVFRTGVFEPIE